MKNLTRISKAYVTTLTMFGILICVSGMLEAKSLWSDSAKSKNYTDQVAVTEGDIILIEISESAQAQTNSEREREKSTELGGQPGDSQDGSTFINDLADWIPIFGATISGESEYESERESDASGSINTRMSVRVDSVREGGILELKGKRKIKIDDEIKNLRFKGLARKADVRSDNTIPSDRIANARIFYEGELGPKKGEARGILEKSWKFLKNVLYY